MLSPGLYISDLFEVGSELIGIHIFGNPLNIKKFYTNTFPISFTIFLFHFLFEQHGSFSWCHPAVQKSSVQTRTDLLVASGGLVRAPWFEPLFNEILSDVRTGFPTFK